MVALTAYFDASKHRESGLLTVAGYLAPTTVWRREFDPAWNSVLSSAPIHVSEFKAANCRHGRGEFENWSRSDRDLLTANLVSVIVARSQSMFGLGASLVVPYSRLSSDAARTRVEGFAYCWCVAMVVGDALRLAGSRVGNDEIQIVLDEEPGFEFKAREVCRVACDVHASEFSDRVRPVSFARSHERPGLQAADLLAYETYKELRAKLSPPDDRLPRSRALSRLLQHQPRVAHHYDMPDLVRTVEGIKAGEIAGDISFPDIFAERKPNT
jgi:hypothetical protein